MPYAISCGHRLTALAAEEVLHAGGNALDGAIAAFAMSWVSEQCMSGPGGGGFAILRHENRIRALDFFTQTPKVKRALKEIEFLPIAVDFGGASDVFHIGHGSTAVPGIVDGIFTLHRMGARLPMTELFAQAIEIAKRGHTIEPFQHYDFQLLKEILAHSDKGRELYFDGNELKPVGGEIYLPELANFMDYLSREGPNAFYRGEIAQQIEEACSSQGGHIGKVDLLEYKTDVQATRQFSGAHYDIHTAGNPSVGGKLLVAIIEASADHLSKGIIADEAMAHGIQDVYDLRDQWFLPGEHIKLSGTTHLNVIDKDCNVVSISTSIGEGSGFFIEGTGIHMNNMLGESNLMPDGLHSWTPDARLMSMMAPTLCMSRDDDLLISLGSGGSWRIPFMVAQVLNRILHDRQNLSEAITAPRIQWDHKLWQAEPGYQRPDHISLEQWHEWTDQNLYFGGVHTSMFHNGNFSAKGDDRRCGVECASNV